MKLPPRSNFVLLGLPLTPVVMVGLAVFQLLLGIGSPSVGTLFGIGLMFVIIWLARPEFLPALMLNQVDPANLTILGMAGSSTATNTVTYALGFAVVVRVTWEFIKRPETFASYRILLLLWYTAMVPAVVMALMGRAELNASWSLPVRTVWISGGFFYGLILAQNWPQRERVINRILLPVGGAMLALMYLGVLQHKLGYLFIPAGVALIWLNWGRLHWLGRGLAVAALFMLMMISVGLGVFDQQDIAGTDGTLGVGGTTFTQNAVLLGGIMLTAAVRYTRGRIRRALLFYLGAPIAITVIVASFVVASVGPKLRVFGTTGDEVLTVEERARVKLFNDRSMIWNATLRDALRGPYLIKPSGRPIWIDYEDGEKKWPFGAHNGVLNTLLDLRWYSGVIILLLYVAATAGGSRALWFESNPTLGPTARALAVMVIATAVVGVFVNDYPLREDAGFWFFAPAGMLSVLARKSRNVKTARLPAEASPASHALASGPSAPQRLCFRCVS
ncbi:MAG: hypothetical protein ACREIA_22800 [Opitutaceae bacterium]